MKKFLKIYLIPILFTIFSLVVTIIYIIKGLDFEHIFSIFGLALAAWVLIVLRLFKLKIPFIIAIGYYTYIFLAIGLGAGFRFYDKWYYFDTMLHIIMGLLLPIVGHYVVILSKNDMNKLGFILFIFSFSMMIAPIWETIEFLLDNLFGMNTQHNIDLIGDGRSGVFDTMKDIICHLGGSLFTVIIYVVFYKKIKYKFDDLLSNE